MKKLLSTCAIALLLTACANTTTTNQPEPITPRAVFEIDRLYIDGAQASKAGTAYEGASLTFVGEEQGGNVLIFLGDTTVHASINPSREHPSFADGYWHHHLYAGATAQGSPRINFQNELAFLSIDDNPEATDNTQSSYQRGNLHYIVDTGEYRLRFTIDGVFHDLIFTEL